jgi:hypothetical protein
LGGERHDAPHDERDAEIIWRSGHTSCFLRDSSPGPPKEPPRQGSNGRNGSLSAPDGRADQ